jgi:hypothetical protein
MRIENMATREDWDRVVLHLSRKEASELRDALDALLQSPLGSHEHVPNEYFTKEITVTTVD